MKYVITAETQMQSWSKNAASQYNLKAGSNTIVIDLLNKSKSNNIQSNVEIISALQNTPGV